MRPENDAGGFFDMEQTSALRLDQKNVDYHEKTLEKDRYSCYITSTHKQTSTFER